MFIKKAIFLDRDGTLIEAVHRPGFRLKSGELKEITAPFTEAELRFASKAYPVIQELRKAGFLDVLVTNQPDVAHGFLTEETWQKIQTRVEDTLELRRVYMCRHRSEDNCDRKKPSPRMLFDAADNLGIDLSRSYMIGDTDADMQAGKAAGCGTILINKFYNLNVDCDLRVPDLVTAFNVILLAEQV